MKQKKIRKSEKVGNWAMLEIGKSMKSERVGNQKKQEIRKKYEIRKKQEIQKSRK